jgi:hypothetical protein
MVCFAVMIGTKRDNVAVAILSTFTKRNYMMGF